jgi:hypothetical protein
MIPERIIVLFYRDNKKQRGEDTIDYIFLFNLNVAVFQLYWYREITIYHTDKTKVTLRWTNGRKGGCFRKMISYSTGKCCLATGHHRQVQTNYFSIEADAGCLLQARRTFAFSLQDTHLPQTEAKLNRSH